MRETLTVAARPVATPAAAGRPMTLGRFQVRPVVWGNRRRYEVVDTRNDAILAVRATSAGAEDDVIVLNLGAPR